MERLRRWAETKRRRRVTKGHVLFRVKHSSRTTRSIVLNCYTEWQTERCLGGKFQCRYQASPSDTGKRARRAHGFAGSQFSHVFTFCRLPYCYRQVARLGHHLMSSHNREYGCSFAIYHCPFRAVLIRQNLGRTSRRVNNLAGQFELINPRTIMAKMGPLQTKSLFWCPPSSPRDSSHGLDVGERRQPNKDVEQ